MLEKDVYRAANLLIKQHGGNALDVAKGKMQHFMCMDDVKAASVWLRVSNAVEKLQLDADGRTTH